MPTLYRVSVALILALVAAFSSSLAALGQTPQATGRVTDLAKVLSVQEVQRITQSLNNYEQETTHQIAVLTTPSLDGESIESYSPRVARAWALGRKGTNNGILIVLAPSERQVRIELGRGFERYITDAQAAKIVRTQMLPSFNERDYAQGLERDIQQLMNEGRHFVVRK